MNSSTQPLTIHPALPNQRSSALRLAFAELPTDERDQQSAVWQPPTTDHMIWIAGRGSAEEIVGVLLCQALAGNTWMVLPPRSLPDEPVATGTALLNVAMEAARGREVCLAQALLPSATGTEADQLRACGFQHAADLLYLGSESESFPDSEPATALTFESLAPATDQAGQEQRLRRLVDATYQGTLDCPLLNGVRGTEDVLASYREVGRYDPARWLIVRHGQVDVGCLLLAEHTASQQWELVYMGLVPAARGHGWGVQIARHAQWLTRSAGFKTLLLAVDAANQHALTMYAATGFTVWDQRSLFLRLF